MENLFKIIVGTFAFTTAVVFTGCGNVMPNPAANKTKPFNSSTNFISNQTSVLSGNCTGKNNILPVSERYYDGSGSFEACAQPSDHYSAILHGKTHNSDSICVFPAQTDASGNIKLLKDATGNLQFQCIKISVSNPSVKFDAAIFNTFLIVESQDQNLMLQCLLSGTDVGCPWYSIGKFRD